MSSQQSYLVIGGCGFLGWAIVQALLARNEPAVAVFDLAQRHEDRRVQFFTGDLCDQDALEKAFKQTGATVIIHTASPLAVGTNSKALFEKVNVEGTRTVVAACHATGVRALVFTSSASVVFAGVDLIDVDERTPYALKPIDEYCRTKIEAEKIVIAANGHGRLKTCSLRPAGIFGPGDRQLIPGLVKVLKDGKTRMQVGDNQNLWDTTYVDNLADAHLLAADKLTTTAQTYEVDVESRMTTVRATLIDPPTPTGVGLRRAEEDYIPSTRSKFDQFSSTLLELAEEDLKENPATAHDPLGVAGQSFFITNGEPIPFWCFSRAVWQEYSGGDKKQFDAFRKPFVLPRDFAVWLGSMVENAAWLVGASEPLFTRFKMVFVSAHRWYNIERARRVLGYEPKVGVEEGIRRTIAWLKEQEAAKAQ